jgi:hypothetical protein
MDSDIKSLSVSEIDYVPEAAITEMLQSRAEHPEPMLKSAIFI